MKSQSKINKKSFFLLIPSLFLTTFLTFKTFKKVNSQDISIFGSEIFSIEDIVNNSSLNFSTPLLLVKTKHTEKELKKNLALKDVFVYRQLFPFGLKILIKTRTPIAYGERIVKGKKINGFIDEDGFFIYEKYADKENLRTIKIKVLGWDDTYKDTLSKIFNSQKNNNIELITINFSPNGFLTLEEKSLNKISLGFNLKIVETQLQIISDIKTQIKVNNQLEKIDNIDLTDPSNPKIKVFKP